MIMDIDYGAIEARIVLTMSGAHLYAPGPVQLSGYTNRHRFTVTGRLSATSAELAHFIRPSRGYARHVRRVKARSR